MGPTIAIVAMVAGTAMSMMGQIAQGQQQKRQYEYNAQIAAINAQEGLNRANETARRQRLELNRMKGTQKTRAAAAGVRVGEGSPLYIDMETEQEGAYQISLTKRAGQVEYAIGQSQAANFRSQGSAAATAGFMGAGASLLSGASSTYMSGKTLKVW